MRNKGWIFTLVVLTGIVLLSWCFELNKSTEKQGFVFYVVELEQQELRLFWQDSNGENYGNFQKLKLALQKDSLELVFAMNGGMYLKDGSPQGLFIENGLLKTSLDEKREGYGNFYLQPNGVFYLTKEKQAVVCTTTDFVRQDNIQFATQSGPMLLIDGQIHPKFREGSKNVHIRNGVGVLPNGNVLFAMSKEVINFYDFASFFKAQGCKNALYLDGFVSRTFLPASNWEQLDGNFGVIIGVVRKT